MIGTKINKKNLDYKEYSLVAAWCNENSAFIVDKGEYYEVVKSPGISNAEKLVALDANYEKQISDIELEMAKAKAIEDEELYADLKTEREELISEYAKKRSGI